MDSIFLIGLIVAIIVFFLCRELLCWYWKINKHLENQDKIINLLEQLNAKKEGTPFVSSPEDNQFSCFVGKQVEVVQKDSLKIRGQVENSYHPDEYLALYTSGDVMRINVQLIKEIKLI